MLLTMVSSQPKDNVIMRRTRKEWKHKK